MDKFDIEFGGVIGVGEEKKLNLIYLNLNNGVLAQRWQIMTYDTQTK